MQINSRKLAYMALLVALNIVLARLFSIRIALGGVEGIRLGLGGLPVILSGILLGPLAGGLVGAVGDVVGYLINPMGAYMPHFTFSAALTGIIPVLVLRLLTNEKLPHFHQLLLAIAAGQVTTSVLLVPYFLHVLFGLPLEATVVPALIGQLISIPVYAGFIKVLLRRLHGVLGAKMTFAG